MPPVYFWSHALFVRLLLPFGAGILLQWYYPLPPGFLSGVLTFSFAAVFLYSLLPVGPLYRWRTANGLLVHLLLAAGGALLVWRADVRNDPRNIARSYRPGDGLQVVLSEVPVEKAASFKALARAERLVHGDSIFPATGKVLLYFSKDAAITQLAPGTRLLFQTPLKDIRGPGNPGSFDYRRYCLFQGITHQVFLPAGGFALLSPAGQSRLEGFVGNCRRWVLSVLQQYMPPGRERGLAEALLIGYKNDLEKSLVQAYTRTGVVHIIAISGLHLGLIYALLLGLTGPLKRRKGGALFRLLVVVGGLWLFSLLAGAQPSVLRSAVMFTCLAVGEALDRRGSALNTLALSAFLLLCYQPFWLWDAGFQLSYAAVASLLLFYRPVAGWVYFPNKAIDRGWRLVAVTIAAQLLTLPVCLYHFHQFPLLFLLTNLFAVPWSSFILIAEILLCVLSFSPPVAGALGAAITAMIRWMNIYIERLDRLPFALWDGLSLSLPQALLLAGLVGALAYWLMEQQKRGLWLGLFCLLGFMGLRSWSFAAANRQQKLIVYNVPRLRAIDLIEGRSALFWGDEALLQEGFARNFYLQPSRVLHRVAQIVPAPAHSHAFNFCGKKVVLLDPGQRFLPRASRLPLDVLVVSGSPRTGPAELAASFLLKQVVLDASVPRRRAQRWQHACDSLGVACHDVAEKGAFEMTVQ
ncbi:ComEC/Rec2 family competence protein [Paraflavisolibacter sp. H34]|uniref:ComEC/Rec2 family competence protein n=1 Tax=Huijunlia imazamoxiresistens TaxID=3127457 RepID=UPI0030168542